MRDVCRWKNEKWRQIKKNNLITTSLHMFTNDLLTSFCLSAYDPVTLKGQALEVDCFWQDRKTSSLRIALSETVSVSVIHHNDIFCTCGQPSSYASVSLRQQSEKEMKHVRVVVVSRTRIAAVLTPIASSFHLSRHPSRLHSCLTCKFVIWKR